MGGFTLSRYRAPAALVLLGLSIASASAQAPLTASQELAKLYEEDQADRESVAGRTQDWEAISIRDERREARVKALLAAGPLDNGAAYYHAAMVLQHATTPDDYLLAHDLCVIAIARGESKAKWLAAASLDRFLMSIGRPQRFGTQYHSSRSFKPPRLYPVDPGVSDVLRQELDVPTLDAAKKKEADMARSFEAARQGRAPS